jgi:hypothetical protein
MSDLKSYIPGFRSQIQKLTPLLHRVIVKIKGTNTDKVFTVVSGTG